MLSAEAGGTKARTLAVTPRCRPPRLVGSLLVTARRCFAGPGGGCVFGMKLIKDASASRPMGVSAWFVRRRPAFGVAVRTHEGRELGVEV